MSSDSRSMVDAAVEAVYSAVRVCRVVGARLDELRSITKDDRSPVTVGDFAAQAVVAWSLAESGFGGPLVAEEASGFLREAGHGVHLEAALDAARVVWPGVKAGAFLDAIDRGGVDPLADGGAALERGFWTLDPIDGTKGFLRGGQYCVSLAYISGGRPVVGVLGCPNLSVDFGVGFDAPGRDGSLYVASAGGDGAWEGRLVWGGSLDEAPERGALRRMVRPVRDRGSALRSCESVESAHSRHDAVERVMRMVTIGLSGDGGDGVLLDRQSARLDSQCKYAVVARGQADVYLRLPTKRGYREKIWDHAAGALVAECCGVSVSDASGRPLDFSRGRALEGNLGIVAAPADLHGAVIGAISACGLDGEPE